eukprot:scpid76594/ scgid9207/ 28S ribosomal protein S22, mitochondrial
MSWSCFASRSASCLASICKREPLHVVPSVVSTSCRKSHYSPRYITLEEREPAEQDRMVREQLEDTAGPEVVKFPNPYAGRSGKVAWLSDHRGVKKTLDRIVTVDLDKVFAPRINRPRPPRFMLATDEQLDVLEEAVLDRAMDLLNRPPIYLQRENIPEDERLIQKNPEIDGYANAKVVVINVDNDLQDDERHVYVRQENGDLEHADYDVRDRMLLTYFRLDSRRIFPEPVFHPVTVQKVLGMGRHKEMLDRIFLQFSGDSSQYINLTEQVYEDVYCRGCYEVLDSTCHFGNLIYYLCREGRWQGVYHYFKSKNRVCQAADLYRLAMTLTKNERESKLLADYLVTLEDIPQAEKELMDRELVMEAEKLLGNAEEDPTEAATEESA